MAFDSTDIKFYFSNGGGPEDLRGLNLGGVMAVTPIEIEHGVRLNWVPDIPRSVLGLEGTSGTWNWYIPCHIKNTNSTIDVTNVKLWIYKVANNPNVNVQVGADPTGDAPNATARTIANNTVAPSGVVFSNSVNEAGSVLIASTLEHGNNRGLWIRLYGPKGIKSKKDVAFGIKVKFTRPA